MTALPPTPALPCETDEHIVLLRHWAGVQDRISRQSCEQTRRCEQLEAELMRLRARWIVATTQMLWGMGWPGLGRAAGKPRRPSSRTRGAGQPPQSRERATPAPGTPPDDWLCQSGCVGHAHHWLGDDGECRLSGQDCARMALPAGRKLPPSSC